MTCSESLDDQEGKRKAMSNQLRSRLMVLSSIVLAVAPKCPICFLAYFGIFGVATSSASVYRVWLPPLTGLWLALTVGMLAIRRGARHRHGPVALGIVAALAVYGGKFIINDMALVYGGIAALVAAVIWRFWFRDPISSASCVPCEQLPVLPDVERR